MSRQQLPVVISELGPDDVEAAAEAIMDRINNHPETTHLGDEDTFYFPAGLKSDVNTTSAVWAHGTNVSLPPVDLVWLTFVSGDGGSIRSSPVRYRTLLQRLGNRIRYQAGRAFILADDWPDDDWIADEDKLLFKLSRPARGGLLFDRSGL